MALFFFISFFIGLSQAFPFRVTQSDIKGSGPEGQRLQAIAANQTGIAVATPFYTNGKNWKTTVTIGGQDLQLLLDTGSSDLLVFLFSDMFQYLHNETLSLVTNP